MAFKQNRLHAHSEIKKYSTLLHFGFHIRILEVNTESCTQNSNFTK